MNGARRLARRRPRLRARGTGIRALTQKPADLPASARAGNGRCEGGKGRRMPAPARGRNGEPPGRNPVLDGHRPRARNGGAPCAASAWAHSRARACEGTGVDLDPPRGWQHPATPRERRGLLGERPIPAGHPAPAPETREETGARVGGRRRATPNPAPRRRRTEEETLYPVAPELTRPPRARERGRLRLPETAQYDPFPARAGQGVADFDPLQTLAPFPRRRGTWPRSRSCCRLDRVVFQPPRARERVPAPAREGEGIASRLACRTTAPVARARDSGLRRNRGGGHRTPVPRARGTAAGGWFRDR